LKLAPGCASATGISAFRHAAELRVIINNDQSVIFFISLDLSAKLVRLRTRGQDTNTHFLNWVFIPNTAFGTSADLYILQTNMKIRVSIADDHPLVINGLIQILQCCDDIEIISTFADGRELLAGLKELQPDILLLDIQMPYQRGDEAAPQILELYKNIRIIALTNQDNTSFLKTMMRHGVAGYILKTSDADTIVDTIRHVYSGGVFVDPNLKEKLVQEALHAKRSHPAVPRLTRREQEVLELIASNFTSQEIADQLFLSKRTIDNHRLSLLLKLDVKNSASMIRKAMQLGLISQ
jgi:DNA-binding NarL/FixJ family response regulator